MKKFTLSKYGLPFIKSKFALPLLGVLVLSLILRSCLYSGSDGEVSYLTEVARRGDIVKTVNASGEVAAAQLVNVGAQVSGQIERLHVELGQVVKKGDLIAEIDSTTQKNDLEINKAKLATYESQLLSRETALKTAQTQYEREVKLKRRDATSDESLENAENALAQARAAVDETKSLITQTRISVNNSETNLGYTKISAPLSGTVVSIPVEEGQTVNANQTTPTIAQVADLSRMEIKMQISEGDVTKVHPGMHVSYTILSEPDRVFEGVLKSVDPGLTTLSDDSYAGSADEGTAVYYYAKLLASNEDGTLRIGMTTQNVIKAAEAKDAIIVPSIAITTIDGASYVQVMEGEGKAAKPVEREIRVGVSDNMNTEVLEGLKEGDVVVAAQMTAEEMAAGSQLRMRGGRMRL